MPVLDLDGLIRYDENIKNYIGRFANWQKSEKAGAVAIYPVPETTLEPTVDFMFTETPPASGDKSPSNPSTITGVSEVNLWLAGKNVNRTMPYYGFTDGVKVNREVTFTANQDGSVTANGTATGGDAICSLLNTNNVTNYGTSIGVGTWRLSGCPSGGSNSTYAIQPILSAGYGSISYDYGSGGNIVVTKPGAMVGVILRVGSGFNAQNLVFRPQIELGTTATSYEQPVEKQKFALPLGGTFYGGTLDVATGVTTVSGQKVTMDGSCSYVYLGGLGNGTGFVAVVVTIPSLAVTKGYFIASRCACNKFPVFSTETPEFSKAGMFLANPNLSYFNYKQVRFYLSLDMLGLSSSATQQEVSNAAKDWFTANPVDAVFTFAEPFSTVQLTPTEILSLTQSSDYDPRVNTVYTDASAVQVGYVKSPIRSEYELTQAIIATEGGE